MIMTNRTASFICYVVGSSIVLAGLCLIGFLSGCSSANPVSRAVGKRHSQSACNAALGFIRP